MKYFAKTWVYLARGNRTLQRCGNHAIELFGTTLVLLAFLHGPIKLAAVALPVPFRVLAMAGSDEHVPPPTFPQLKPHAHGPITSLHLSLKLLWISRGRLGSHSEEEEDGKQAAGYVLHRVNSSMPYVGGVKSIFRLPNSS